MSKIQLGDLEFYYKQEGSGPDLVFISGLSCDHTMWEISRFTKHFRVLVFDNRGVGRTDVPKHSYDMITFAKDTIHLCRALGIERAHFVGHSMGGHITQLIAAYCPDIVEKAVIACSAEKMTPVSYYATKLQVELRGYNIPMRMLIENFLPVLFSLEFLDDEKRVERFINGTLRNRYPQTEKGYMQQVEALQGHNTKAILHLIDCPALIIGCDEDLLTPLENSKYLKKHIKHSKLEVITECGHAPFIEKPSEFYGLIKHFLMA